MLELCARAAQESPAWPAVYGAGTARVVVRAVLDVLMQPTPAMATHGIAAMARDDLEPAEDEFRAGFAAAIRSLLD